MAEDHERTTEHLDVQPTDDGPLFSLRDMLGFTVTQGEGTGTAVLDVDERHIIRTAR